MSREIKFRVWNKNTNKYEYTELDYYFVIDQRIKAYVYEQYTGLKDKNGDKEIYEYDIIDGGGNTIGNYHETPELLKDKTNLLIQGFGTKTWLTTYQEAVERGCHDA